MLSNCLLNTYLYFCLLALLSDFVREASFCSVWWLMQRFTAGLCCCLFLYLLLWEALRAQRQTEPSYQSMPGMGPLSCGYLKTLLSTLPEFCFHGILRSFWLLTFYLVIVNYEYQVLPKDTHYAWEESGWWNKQNQGPRAFYYVGSP